MRVPIGRFEHRIAKTQVEELVPVSESPIAKVEAFTENVSPRGARIITDSACAPGKLVRLDALAERLNLMARVVYYQRLDEGKVAVGL
jgi:hypothetical protein